jgi:hypothetical protein
MHNPRTYDRTSDARREAGLRLLNNFCEGHAEDPLAWALAPRLRILYTLHSTGSERPGKSRNTVDERAFGLLAAAARLYPAPRVLPEGAIVGGACLQAMTENQRQVILPVAAGLAGGRVVLSRLAADADRARTRELTTHAVDLWRGLLELAIERDAGLPASARALGRLLVSSARHFAYAERLIEQHSPEVLVLATTQAPEPRALLSVARARGIPTVYLPHAPVLRDPYLQDLPCDYAGLRGEREVAMSSPNGCGVQPELVGTPAIEEPGLAPLEPDAPVVLAPSPFDPQLVAELCRMVEHAAPPRVVVAPHPRQDLSVLRRACPPEWEIATIRTVDLLREGARCIVQHSSGVALEAMLLGIPVIECTLGRSQPPAYPFLADEFCHRVDDGPSLRRALEAIDEAGGDPSGRERLRAWGRSWCSPCGPEAVGAACELIRRAHRDGPRAKPIRDVWAEVAAGMPPTAASP